MAPDKVVWTAECETAFQTLMDRMTSAPVLHLPDLTQPFVLRTDASDLGLGAVLLQRDPKNAETLFPVAYASRKLRPAETHYATSEKECL
ncbi:ribonuclease H family protein, partial [Acinetobacter baumannii]|uniref:ribonuclease H family protein n=1 Tax=Acinetobacter baumannii TaxID=470 RepID=UPI0033934BFD